MAEDQPIHHPPKTGRTLRNWSFFPAAESAARTRAHTSAQPMLYLVYGSTRPPTFTDDPELSRNCRMVTVLARPLAIASAYLLPAHTARLTRTGSHGPAQTDRLTGPGNEGDGKVEGQLLALLPPARTRRSGTAPVVATLCGGQTFRPSWPVLGLVPAVRALEPTDRGNVGQQAWRPAPPVSFRVSGRTRGR